MEDYRTIRGTAIGEYEEKKSRFIAALSFADSEEAAVAFLEQVRAANRTARHNVYAYRLREGNRERYSDDGEPAKTAGTPALEVLQHSGLTDLIVVVTRYFGGTLLGTGGLVRAYGGAVQEGLKNCVVLEKCLARKWKVGTDYSGLGKVQYILAEAELPILDSEYGEGVDLTILVPFDQAGAAEKKLIEGTNGRCQIEKLDEVYFGMDDGKIILL